MHNLDTMLSTIDLVLKLRALPIFNAVDAQDLLLIVNVMSERDGLSGELLVSQEVENSTLTIPIDATLESTRDTKQEVSYFGIHDVLEPSMPKFDIRFRKGGRIIQLERKDLLALMRSNHDLHFGILLSLNQMAKGTHTHHP